MDSLKSAIVQGPVFLEYLASCKTWFDRYGQSASLNEVANKMHDAQARVREWTFIPRQK